MRVVTSLAFLLVCAACQQSQQSDTAVSAKGSRTATDFSGVNLSDTTEAASYAAPGEELAKAAGAAMVGKAAPIAVMKTIDGKTIDLGQFYGKKPVYIKFWATWCVPCRQQMPAFQKLFETLGDKVEVVALNIGLSDDLDSVRAFQKKFGITMPVVMDDGRLAQLFNLRVTPQHVLVGRDAKFAYVGHADNQALADAIQAVLKQPMSTVAAAQFVAATVQKSYKVGDVVSALSATTMTGAKVSLAAAQPGRLRGVLFFSSWCEWYLEKSRPGTAKACALTREAVVRLSGKDSGVDWVAIAGGPWATVQDLSDYKKKHNVAFPLALDGSGDLFRAFGIRDIPTIALIDSKGRIVKMVGPSETDLAGVVQSARRVA